MSFQLPSLPNFSAAIPQTPSPIDQYGRMLQLKSLLGQQQLIPLQVQEAQQNVKAADLQNQQRQLELSSQQAMVKAWSDPDFAKSLTGTPSAESSGVGFDPDAMTKGLISKGVLPKDAMAMTGQFLERSKNIAEIYKTQQQGGEAQAAQREKGYKILADQLGGVMDAPAAKAGDMLMQLKADMVKNPQKYSGVPVEDLQHVIAADLEHLPAIATMIGLDGKIADFHKAKSDAAAAAQKVIPPGESMSPEMKGEAARQIAVDTNPQVQANKIQVAMAEAKGRQLIAGIAEPVYAIDAKGNKVLMSKTDAIQQGVKAMLPVTEKEVGDDTMLINRLGDVRQKIARYDQALQGEITASDRANIGALIGKDKLKVGAFGTELPVDRLNSMLDAENIRGLSANAKKLLIAYYNARESMLGYQRVLSGSGRSSDTTMELNLDALPNPSTADQDYARESLKQFRENLDVVGQGLPKIPGVKSPEEIERQVTQPQAETRIYQGHTYVKQSDGSWALKQ